VKTVQALIDLARDKVHTNAALARELGVPATHIPGFRSGDRPVSPETVAKLCALLQLSPEEAREWLAVSLIENPKNSSRAEVLRKAFFASSLGALAVSFLSPTNADAQVKCANIQGVEVCPTNGMTGEQQQAADQKKRDAARRKKPTCKGAKWLEPDGWACPENLEKNKQTTKTVEALPFPAFGTVATNFRSSVYYVNYAGSSLSGLAGSTCHLARSVGSAPSLTSSWTA